MKTVIDAVNEFKGEYEKSYDDDYDRCILLAKKNHREDGDRWHKGIIYFGGMTFNEDVFKLVCTREEFNQCVDMLIGDPLKLIKWKESKPSFVKYGATLSKIGPVHKPVYTQELEDNGSIVEAGMLFATEAGEYTAEYTNKKSIVFTDEDGFLISINRRYAKPIDTRTDEEKALDDLMDAYWDNCNKKVSRHSPIVIKFIDAIKAGKIHNVTWSK